jgi:hypothetical protein
MPTIYAIYSAPRTQQGIYRFCEDRPIYRKFFDSLESMHAYWETHIIPHTRIMSGPQYELSMVVDTRGKWGYHKKPRYAEIPILHEDYRF